MSTERLTWRGYLRRCAAADAGARLLLELVGATPSAMLKTIERVAFPDDGREIRLHAFERLCEDFKRRRPIVDYRDMRDWEHVPGGYRRKNHLGDPNR